MKKYVYTIDIKTSVSVKRLSTAYRDANQMKLWQPHLKTIKSEKGHLFDTESSGYLIYETSEGAMRMDVLVANAKEDVFDVTYQVPGVINRTVNHFKQMGDNTLWRMDVTFTFEQDDVPLKAIFKEKTRQSMMLFIQYLVSKNEKSNE